METWRVVVLQTIKVHLKTEERSVSVVYFPKNENIKIQWRGDNYLLANTAKEFLFNTKFNMFQILPR